MGTDFIELMKKALEMEEKGYKFYKEAAGKGKNAVTREIFDFLAKSEIFHIDSIKKFCNGSKNGAVPKGSGLVDLGKKRNSDMLLFSSKISELKGKITDHDSESKIYEFALELENNGYKYYSDMRAMAKDDDAVMLLDFLLKEEKKHYELLSNLQSYMMDPANWNMYEEKSFPQG